MQEILVIAEDESYRQLIALTLEQDGYRVEEASDGEEGIHHARTSHPDLIICDLSLQHVDGYTTLLALCREQSTSGFPLIVLAGEEELHHWLTGANLGGAHVIKKPFHVSELMAAVEMHFSGCAATGLAPRQAPLAVNAALPRDLRYAVTLILGFADILIEDAGALQPTEVSEMGQAIKESGIQLQRFIGNYMIAAQLEEIIASSKRMHDVQLVDLVNFNDHIVPAAQLKAEAAHRTRDLHLNITKTPVPLPGDHVMKIFEELLDNAFRFSEPGTPVQAAVTTANSDLFITVSDRGRGMNTQEITAAGSLAISATNVHEHPHSGFGLAIVKSLAHLDGGEVKIKSQSGEGTTVIVRLPLKLRHHRAVA